MAFDFPAAPTEGQTYRPAGGPTYIFHSPVWQVVAVEPVAYVATADAQNRIVNPAMQHSQEQGNTLIGIGYPADQWSHTHTMTGGETVQRVATSTPNGSQYRLQLKCSTAQAGGPTAAQYAVLLQAIEGNFIADLEWGTPEAKPIVVRFGFKAPAGTYSVTLKNGLSNLSYATSFVITAGQANIDTEQIITIPGPTTGTWSQDTTLGMTLTFATACGTTYTVPLANVWTVGNYLAAPGQ